MASDPLELVRVAHAAGYKVLAIEHPRSRRWLLTLSDADGDTSLLMIQSRSLIGATDVLDLAELVRVRRLARGVLLAYDGVFSIAAHRTCAELGARNLRLCTTWPQPVSAEAQ